MDRNGSPLTPGVNEPGMDGTDDLDQTTPDEGDPTDYSDPPDAGAGDFTGPDAGEGTPGDPSDASLGDPMGQDGSADSVNRTALCPNGSVDVPTSPRPISKYRNLRIIGNAGGWLDTNQLEYPKLVDIFVSFEQTYDEASRNDWSRLKRQVTSVPQLALIHTNSSDLDGAVTQAFARGYTHVYTRSLPLLPNVWNGLPPYFTTEVSTVADRRTP